MLSDSESTSGDSQRLPIESSNSQLRELNDSLQRENLRLRTQFEEAMKLTAQFKSISDRNVELERQNRASMLELENRTERIELLTETNRELQEKLTDGNRQLSEARALNSQAAVREEAGVHSKLTQQITRLSSELSEVKREKDVLDLQVRKLVSDQRRVLTSAEYFFQLRFHNIEELIVQLENPGLPAQAAPVDVPRKKTKKGKRNSHVEQHCAALEEEIVELKRIATVEELKQASKVDALKRELDECRANFELADLDQKHQIRRLEERIRSLTEKRSDEKPARPPAVEKSTLPAVKKSVPVQAKLAFEEIIQEFEERNGLLTREFRQLQEQHAVLQQHAKTLEGENRVLQKQSEKVTADLANLQLLYKLKAEEIETLRASFKAQSAQSPKDAKRDSLKAMIIQLQGQIDSQAVSIRQLTFAKDQAVSEAADHSRKVGDLSRAESDHLEEIKRLRNELLRLREAARSQPEPQQVHWSTLQTSLFDPAIRSEMDRIASASELSVTVKIQSIYRAIHKYYSHKIRDFEAVSRERQNYEEAIRNFLTDFSLPAISLDQFLAGTDGIAASLAELRGSLDALKRSNEVLTTFVKHFHDCFHLQPSSDPSIFIAQLNGVSSQVQHNHALLAKRKKELRKLRKSLSSQESIIETIRAEGEEKERAAKADAEQLTAEAEKLKSACKKSDREVRSLRNELERSHKLQEETECAFEKRYQDMLTEQVKVADTLRDHTRVLQASLDAASLEIENSRATIAKLTKRIRVNKASAAEKDLQIEHFREKLATAERERVEGDAAHEREYQTSMMHLTTENDNARKDIERIRAELESQRKATERLKSQLSLLHDKNGKLEQDLALKAEQLEREKKLSEAARRSQMLTAESSFGQKLEEHKGRFESEKQRLMAFAADNFRQFVSFDEAINEEAFKRLIVRARDEIQRLASSDFSVRRLVRAPVGQRTEDAVEAAVGSIRV